MTDEPKKQSWWQTVPGVLAALATFITALGGLLITLHQVGLLQSSSSPPPAPANPNTPAVVVESSMVPSRTPPVREDPSPIIEDEPQDVPPPIKKQKNVLDQKNPASTSKRNPAPPPIEDPWTTTDDEQPDASTSSNQDELPGYETNVNGNLTDNEPPPVNISGYWYDATGTVYVIQQQGSNFTMTAANLVTGLQASGNGSIYANHVAISLQTTIPSYSSGTMVLSPDGSTLAGTMTDSVMGPFMGIMFRSQPFN
jgi:hypothetical protein